MAKNKKVSVMPEKRSSGVYWIAAILCVQLILGLVYWHYTPFGDAPDEAPHASYVSHLVDAHSFPVYDKASEIGYEFYQPPLYYMAAVPFYMVGRACGMGNPGEVVRLLSILLGMLSVLLAYKTILLAFPEDERIAIACAGFVALLPTNVMMNSAVSNDILMDVVFGGALFIMVSILTSGLSLKKSLAPGVVLGIGILSKLTCLALFPVAAVACLFVWKNHKEPCRRVLIHAGMVLAISMAVGGWWLVRNVIVYRNLLALPQMQQAFFAHSQNPIDLFKGGMSAGSYLLMLASWTFDSFWGVFGHMDILMPDWTYWFLALVSAAVFVGSCIGVREIALKSSEKYGIVFVFMMTIAFVVIAFIKLNTTIFQAQGRYLYPGLVPISFCFIIGIRKLIPTRNMSAFPYIMIAGIFVLVQVVALATLMNS